MEEDTREQMGTVEETAKKARILHCSFICISYETRTIRYACTGMSKGSLSLLFKSLVVSIPPRSSENSFSSFPFD